MAAAAVSALRSISRSPLPSPSSPLLRISAARGALARSSPSLLATRSFSAFAPLREASPVAGQPGSTNLKDVKDNAKSEAKKVTGDIASAITGGNDPKGTSHVKGGGLEELEESVGGLGSLAGNVPKEAWVFGGAGLLPYVGTSVSAIYLARQASLAEQAGASSSIDLDTALALLHHVEQIQISYGAVILSFLGALHWGFEFAKYGGTRGYPRYLTGIVPVLLGWPSLLLPAQMALATQWAAFASVWYIDSRATARGWAPKWFSTYRFGLTAVVGSCILLTLGVSNYYQAGSIAGAAHKLKQIKASPQVAVDQVHTEGAAGPKIAGTVKGDFETKEGDDAYVKFENVEKRKEEERKKAEEVAEKKKEQDLEKAKAKKEEALEAAKEKRDKAEGRA